MSDSITPFDLHFPSKFNLCTFITKQNVVATTVVDPFCGSRKTTNAGTLSFSNLQAVLSSLRLNASNVGFYNYSLGHEPDTVYGLYVCRGDVSLSLCRECIAKASCDFLQLCPNSSDAFVWYDQRMLRLATSSSVRDSTIRLSLQQF
uniref:Gnk2-homologous domain-containing protein n=1 Tax=Populus alba TaxID=43335 RepID=A0A4U5MBE5_POPAL|nr:hypothetical protein D5086_0000311570 [Populus alba]